MNTKKILKKTGWVALNVAFRIAHPRYWVSLHKVSYDLDEKVRGRLNEWKASTETYRCDGYDIIDKGTGQSLWVANYPYGSGSSSKLNRSVAPITRWQIETMLRSREQDNSSVKRKREQDKVDKWTLNRKS